MGRGSTVKILSQIDLAVLCPVLFWFFAFPFSSFISSSFDISWCLLLPRSCSTMHLSLAATSMKAELPSGRVPMTLVLLLISRLMLSIPSFVLIRRQRSGGNSVWASVSGNPSRTVLAAAPRSFGTLCSTFPGARDEPPRVVAAAVGLPPSPPSCSARPRRARAPPRRAARRASPLRSFSPDSLCRCAATPRRLIRCS